MNPAKNTTSNRLILSVFFSLLTVVWVQSVAYGDLLYAPNNGLLDDAARFAQRDYSEVFSSYGIKGYSKIAGKRIVTIDDLSDAIRAGKISPSQVPIDVIRRGDSTLILNTRSSEALRRAGIPRSQWNVIDRSGDSLFQDRLSGQLRKNFLDENAPGVRRCLLFLPGQRQRTS